MVLTRKTILVILGIMVPFILIVYFIVDNVILNGFMTLEKQEKLFTPYHRAQQDRQCYPGIGLGLAVCSQIIQAHGGKIWVESLRDKGSSFKFVIPLFQEKSDNIIEDGNKGDKKTRIN